MMTDLDCRMKQYLMTLQITTPDHYDQYNVYNVEVQTSS